jgi:hypothetical protein
MAEPAPEIMDGYLYIYCLYSDYCLFREETQAEKGDAHPIKRGQPTTHKYASRSHYL